jgi:hypothetical protein
MADANGGCLCGGVRYSITGPLNPVLACHCSMCAKTTGNYAAMTACELADLRMRSEDTLRWYASSPSVDRGFCSRCGGNVFWKQKDSTQLYITAGSLDKPTGVRVAEHIFVGSKSDFYDIADGSPQKVEW